MTGKTKMMSQVKQLLRMPGQGVGIKTIAKRLGISRNTVQSYLTKVGICDKSFIASGLGKNACSQGYKVKYYNFLKLMSELNLARIDGTIHNQLNQIAKLDLLIIDDFGIAHLDQRQQLDLMEIIEDRHGKKATIIASQLPVKS